MSETTAECSVKISKVISDMNLEPYLLQLEVDDFAPEQRHIGLDIAILAKRSELYKQAKSNHPERWSGDIRNWEPVKEVYLNPEKKLS